MRLSSCDVLEGSQNLGKPGIIVFEWLRLIFTELDLNITLKKTLMVICQFINSKYEGHEYLSLYI